MKPSILLLFTLLTFLGYAQNKKSLLKEVNAYKYAKYSNNTYKTTPFELKQTLYNYFVKEGYKVFQEKDSSVSFTKNVTVSCSKNPNSNVNKNERYEQCTAIHMVNVEVIGVKDSLSIKLNTQLSSRITPFTSIYSFRQLGHYKFNTLNLLEHLYLHYNKTPVMLEEELATKIENYNTEQSKEKKQLIAGRDY